MLRVKNDHFKSEWARKGHKSGREIGQALCTRECARVCRGVGAGRKGMQEVEGAGFDEILANARGTEGEEALVRELCSIRIYNRLAYLPLDLQGYLRNRSRGISALIFIARGNRQNGIPSLSFCTAQGGRLPFTSPLRSFGEG
jgi:hypothetical protein